ncbi:MAG: hypothetical protein GX667_10770 [Xanthomonadaceae bacterium]|nr:hypothetical protein [Xanthomonadaceae bacterium]
MQLETMQYFDSTMQNAPRYDRENIVGFLKWALCDEKDVSFTKQESQELIFNNGHKMTELTFYTFDCGDVAIRSYIDIVNDTTVRIRKDLSGRKIERVFIESYKFSYEQVDSKHVFTNERLETKYGFYVENNTIYFFVGATGNASKALSREYFPQEDNGWKAFISSDSILFFWPQNGKPSYLRAGGYSGFLIHPDSRDHLVFCQPIGSVNNYEACGVSSAIELDIIEKKITDWGLNGYGSSGKAWLVFFSTTSGQRHDHHCLHFNNGLTFPASDLLDIVPAISNTNGSTFKRLLTSANGPGEEKGDFWIVYLDDGTKIAVIRAASAFLMFNLGGDDGFNESISS